MTRVFQEMCVALMCNGQLDEQGAEGLTDEEVGPMCQPTIKVSIKCRNV